MYQEIAIAVLSAVVSFAASWGAMRVRVDSVRDSLKPIHEECSALRLRYENLHKEYVTQIEFSRTQTRLEKSIETIQADIKQILQIVNSKAHSED